MIGPNLGLRAIPQRNSEIFPPRSSPVPLQETREGDKKESGVNE